MERIKNCKVCNVEFTAKSDKAKYCSNACCVADFRKRQKYRAEDMINEVVPIDFHKESSNDNINKRLSTIEKQIIEISIGFSSGFLNKSFLAEFRNFKEDNTDKINGLSNENTQLKAEIKLLKNEIFQFKNKIHDHLFQIKGMKLDIENTETKQPSGLEVGATLFTRLMNKHL